MMANQIEKCYMENIQFPEYAFSVKKEECEESVVHVSETIISVSTFKFQDPMPDDKLKHYGLSPILDDIKVELSSSEEQYYMINDNGQIENGIGTDNIKIDVDKELLYCEHCQAYYKDYCIECGMLIHVLNKNNLNNTDRKIQGDLPNNILAFRDSFDQLGIYALKVIPAGVKFGPFTGLSKTECLWKIKKGKFIVNEGKSHYLNWMQYINAARNIFERNLVVFQYNDNLYYRSICKIHAGDELLVYFGEEYEDSLNDNVEMDFIPATEHIVDNVFACTFCSIGFNSKYYLDKHKTICLEDATPGDVSVEELTQCPLCKIHLYHKEYFEHHLTCCWERNVRQENPDIKFKYNKEEPDYKIAVHIALQILTRRQQIQTKKKLNAKNRERIMLRDGSIIRVNHVEAIKLHEEGNTRFHRGETQ